MGLGEMTRNTDCRIFWWLFTDYLEIFREKVILSGSHSGQVCLPVARQF